jgi:hypothetical protein
MRRAGAIGLLLVACVGHHDAEIRAAVSKVTQCSPSEVWTVEDRDGWASVGCGQYSAGHAVDQVDFSGPATCEQLADFERRYCERAQAGGSSMPGMSGSSASYGAGSMPLPSTPDPGHCQELADRRYNECMAAAPR